MVILSFYEGAVIPLRELVKTTTEKEPVKKEEVVLAGVLHVSAAVAGLIASKATVSGSMIPFGLSFLAGCPQSFVPAVSIGVFIGYFLPAITGGAFRYIAALFALLAIRLLFSGYKKLGDNPLFLSGLCLLSVFFTSVVSLHNVGHGFLGILAECLLAAGGTWFCHRGWKAAENRAAGLTADELVSLFLTLSILVLGLNGISWGGIALGSVAGFAMVLTAAKYGGILSGTVCGTALAFMMLLNGTSGEIALLYAFTGLLAGAFSGFGKHVQAVVPLALILLCAVQSRDLIAVVAAAVAATLGTALFLLLPRRAGITVSRLFSATPHLVAPTGFQRSLSLRLHSAADALSDVSETVEQVSSELSKINSPDFSGVIAAIEQDACAGCKLRLHCWEKRRDETLNALLCMTDAVKRGAVSPEDSPPEEFKGRCIRLPRMANTVYARYSDYVSRIAAENRIEEVRSVVSDQFDGLSAMLAELAEDLENDLKFDDALAEKAAAALKNLNIHTEECSCRIDRCGRASIEMKIKRDPHLVLNKLQIMKMASIACERDFDVPTVNRVGGSLVLHLTEHAALRVDVGVEQKSASASSMCGDAYQYFQDGKGHFIMILSDGMGTGGRAAVDGAMASGLMTRLLKAGFGYDSALKILNSSMLFKSTDESLATVDIASIDLFNGRIELYKAGAAPTLIRRSGRTGKAESTSLPAGILREVSFDKAALKCKVDDIVVLLSDGAVCDGTDWIKKELEDWQNGTAQELAERLCEGARRRRTDKHQDDITVMTAILKKSV